MRAASTIVLSLLAATQVTQCAFAQPVANLELYDAIRLGRSAVVEEYLGAGGDPNERILNSPLQNARPLKVAVLGRRESIALALLGAGARTGPAEIELRDLSAAGMDEALSFLLEQGDSTDVMALKNALDAAATFGYFDSASVLLSALRETDADLTIVLWDAMNLSIGLGFDDIARMLLDGGAPASGAALRAASLRSSPGMVQNLLRLGADPQERYRDPLADIRPKGRNGFRAIDYVWVGYEEGTPAQQQAAPFKLFDLLAAGGTSVRVDAASVAADGEALLSDIGDASERLVVASDWGFYYTVQELLAAHPRPDPDTLMKAVIAAIDAGWDDIARLLLDAGAPPGGGPLHYAVRKSSPGLVRYLLALGAHPNELLNGYSPVDYWWRDDPSAPEKGPRRGSSREVLYELVDGGADVCWLVDFREELAEHNPFSLNAIRNHAPQCWPVDLDASPAVTRE